MSCKGNVAEKALATPELVKKVWATPELAEKILSFASLESTLSLAQSKLMPRNILESPCVWNKLIRRSCPLNGPKVEILVQILKRMKNPKAPLLDLLDLICEQSPAPAWSFDKVEMGCPRHPDSHLIWFEDFELLEQIEGALGTAEQTVRAVNASLMKEPTFAPLSARLSRQQEKVAVFSAWRIKISSMEGAEAWKTIMEACEEYKPIAYVQVLRGLGEEGWEVLAECLRLRPGLVGWVETTKDAMDEGQKDHLREIWDAISGYFQLFNDDDVRSFIIDKSEGEAGWERVERYMDMSKEEVFASLVSDSEEESSEESKMEGEVGDEEAEEEEE